MTGWVLERAGNQNMVMFNGMGFIFCFLPLFLAAYYLTPAAYRNIVLFLGSILFYALGEPFFVVLLLASVGMNYLFATELWYDGNNHIWKHKKRRQYLIAIVLLDVLMLAGFKLLHLYETSFLQPLGISFFTFKMISFQIDAYKGLIKKPEFIKTAAYFTMFPQVTSGPIMRYQDAEGAFEKPCCTTEYFEDGLKYFILGLSAKVLLADRLAMLWNELQSIGFESISTPLAWLGAGTFSLNLYFDFAGYSLMASGICMMLGFPFIVNFNHPYAATSIRDFWHRWHMTLGAWFRDYVYIPLGGSRKGMPKTLCNLLLVWLLTGIWHGSGWNFLLWGLILFVLIAAEKLFLGKWLSRFGWLGHLYVLFVIPLTWVVFSLTDLSQLGLYMMRLFPFFGQGAGGKNPHDFTKYFMMYGSLLTVSILCCIPAAEKLYQKCKKNILTVVVLVLLFWLDIYFLANAVNNPFRYFAF